MTEGGAACCAACSADMGNEISVQLATFGRSILLGMGFGLLYDVLLLLRLRHPRVTFLTDGA